MYARTLLILLQQTMEQEHPASESLFSDCAVWPWGFRWDLLCSVLVSHALVRQHDQTSYVITFLLLGHTFAVLRLNAFA